MNNSITLTWLIKLFQQWIIIEKRLTNSNWFESNNWNIYDCMSQRMLNTLILYKIYHIKDMTMTDSMVCQNLLSFIDF